MHYLHLSLFSFLLYASQVLAGNVTEGGKCSVGNSRLQGGTFQFWSECDSVTFCSPQGFCEPRQCRQDDFPFGYKPEEKLPPKCERGQFCPDEMSGCLPQIPVGQHCQQNRDGKFLLLLDELCLSNYRPVHCPRQLYGTEGHVWTWPQLQRQCLHQHYLHVCGCHCGQRVRI